MSNCNDEDLICGSDLCDQGCENGGFTIFGTGASFPQTSTPTPTPNPQLPTVSPKTFSFYSVRGATVISGGVLPLSLFAGTLLPVTDDGVVIQPGNVYVSYNFQCSTENNVVFAEVVPFLNGTAFTPGVFKAVRTPSGLHSEASGTFMFVSDSTTALMFRAVTDADVSINNISFDLLIIPAF